MKTIGDNIKKLRKEANLTQPELADRINVAKSVISNWEQNLNIPKGNYIIELAKIFNVSADYILGLTDNDDFFTTSQDSLSDDQQYILKEYNKLSSTDKQKIINYMAVSTTRAEKKSDNSLTPMEEELIRMTRKLEDKNQLAQILGFLEELLESSSDNAKKHA